MGKHLFLNIQQDNAGRWWGIAKICLKDGSCLIVESRIYKQATPGSPGIDDGAIYVGEDDDENPRAVALDEALNKLCRITEHKNIMRAIPLPARLALKTVCTARNLIKISRAAEDEGDEETVGKARRSLKRLASSDIGRRAIRAQRLWA